MKITYCKPDPLLDDNNRLYFTFPKGNHSKIHKDFADLHSIVDGKYVGKGVNSNFPAQYEQLEVNKQMKEFAQYDTGFRPVMK